MSQTRRGLGGVVAALGCLSLGVPFVLLSLGPEAFGDGAESNPVAILFRHLGRARYFHACFGLVASALMVFGGAALYYGRAGGFALLKAALWFQLVYIAFVEATWLYALHAQLRSHPENIGFLAGATAGAVFAGIAAGTGILAVLWLLRNYPGKEGEGG